MTTTFDGLAAKTNAKAAVHAHHQSYSHAHAHAHAQPFKMWPPRRSTVLKWLRKVHLYIGLWGALLGMTFGATGILLNHRNILEIPLQRSVETSMQLPVPQPAFSSVAQMADWLQKKIKLTPVSPPKPRVRPPKKIIFGEQEVTQPERWSVNLSTPKTTISAEYFVGNHFVKVDRNDATVIGLLTRLHTSTGVSAFWVILSDSIAGSLILLCLSGLLLWTQLHTVRTIAMLTSVGALLTALGWMVSLSPA